MVGTEPLQRPGSGGPDATPERSDDVRILGVGRAIADFHHTTTRNSGLFAALNERYDVVGTLAPRLSRIERYAANLRYVYPDRDGWRSRAGLNPRVFRAMTASVERGLRDWEGRYDLIMLINTAFAPGLPSRQRRYTLYTDNIHVLTARYFPQWAPLSDRDRAKRIVLERQACRSARFVFAKTGFLRDALIAEYGCEPERVVKVVAGANSIASSLEGKRYDSRVALFVGIHFERKGGRDLLDAWPRVRERLPEAELWIVGPKKPPVGADQPGVRWHGFVSDRARLADLYARAAAFVLPALFEPYGGVVMEAKGQGLPCIVTGQGGFGESVEHGIDGLHVPAGEPEPLADALVALLGDPQAAARMGHRAHAEVLRQYTWAHVVDRMAPFIERAAASPD